MMRFVINIAFVFQCLFFGSHGYKILVYNPRFGASHVSFMGKIADTLANAGHDVVVYQPILEKTLTKNGSSNSNIKFIFSTLESQMRGIMEAQDELWEDNNVQKLISVSLAFQILLSNGIQFQMTKEMQKIRKSHCDFVLGDNKNHELLKKENFDIAVVEIFECCGFGVLEILGIKKYVATHSSSMIPMINSYLGIPQSPSSIPSGVSLNTDKMSFLQRTGNFIETLLEYYIMDQVMIGGPREAASTVLPGMDINVNLFH